MPLRWIKRALVCASSRSSSSFCIDFSFVLKCLFENGECRIIGLCLITYLREVKYILGIWDIRHRSRLSVKPVICSWFCKR
jgi:hypothetical protein